MKIYLASSWRNEYQASVLRLLRAAGFEVYDFKNPRADDRGFGWKQITDEPLTNAATLRRVLAHPIAKRGFGFDYEAMQWADVCVLLLPCGNSAHLEAGWFAGRGKPVVVLAPEIREPELMYKLFDSDADTPIFADTIDAIDWLDQMPDVIAPG